MSMDKYFTLQLMVGNYFLGGTISIPAKSPITLTSDEPVGTTILELLVRDFSTACNWRSVLGISFEI